MIKIPYADFESLKWTRVIRPQMMVYEDLVNLCEQNKSTGKFFVGYGGEYIWFEKSEDATWLVLWHV
jgi:hypothetical protein